MQTVEIARRTTRPSAVRLAGAAVATIGALLLTGCGAIGGDDPQSGPTVTVTAPGGGASTAPPTTPSSGETPGEQSTDQPTEQSTDQPAGDTDLGDPAGSRTVNVGKGGAPLKLDVYKARRTGGSLTVTIKVTVVRGKGVNLNTLLSDNDYDAGDKGGFAPDGIRIIDGKNKKVHLVASDGKGACFCSPRELLDPDLDSGGFVMISAVFAAPPADVSAVDVQIPSFGVFSNVPIA